MGLEWVSKTKKNQSIDSAGLCGTREEERAEKKNMWALRQRRTSALSLTEEKNGKTPQGGFLLPHWEECSASSSSSGASDWSQFDDPLSPHRLPKPSPHYLPDDSPVRKIIINMYYALFGVKGERKTARGRESNPAPNPCSFTRRDLEVLAQHPDELLARPKSNGVRYQLFLGRLPGGKIFSVMLDRRMYVYPVKVMAEDSYFLNTLIDGELVFQKEPGGEVLLCWWAWDIYALKGLQLRDQGDENRIRYIQRVLPPPLEVLGHSPRQLQETLSAMVRQHGVLALMPYQDDQPLIHVRLKPVDTVTKMAARREEMRHLGHELDGWIFTRADGTVVPGAQNAQWKFKLHHTIDLELRGRVICNLSQGAAEMEPKITMGLYYIVADHTCPHADILTRCETQGKITYRNACTREGALELSNGDPVTFRLVMNEKLRLIMEEQKRLWRLKRDEATSLGGKGSELSVCELRFHLLVECEASFSTDTELLCRILHVRTDKIEPNNRTCLRLTLDSVREQMSEELLWNILLSNVKEKHVTSTLPSS